MQQKGLKAPAKIVLYWIADHHNSETEACFPSLSTLAEECEMDRTTVIRHIDTLCSMGLIDKVERNRGNGSRTSNGYGLNLVKQPVVNCDPPRRKMQPPPVAKCDPHNLVNTNLGNITSNKDMSIFDDLWKMYPKKQGKGTAKTALVKALRKVPADQLQHSLALFVQSWGNKDRKYLPFLATWLNGERWDDEIQEASLQDMSSDQQMQAILGSVKPKRHLDSIDIEQIALELIAKHEGEIH